MAKDNSGNTAREMAAAPIMGVAGSGIKDALKEAAIQSSIDSARELATKLQTNPLADLFGKPVFRLPDSFKVYTDDKRPTITTRRMAFVAFLLGGVIEIDASIYAQEELKKDDNGSYIERTLNLSLPTANRQQIFKIPKGQPISQMMLEQWKYSTVQQFEDWAAELATASPSAGSDGSMTPRHVKRIPVPPVTTLTSPIASPR